VRAEDAESLEHHPRTALLVNLAESTVEVHREPDPTTGSYRARTAVSSGETLTAASVPAVRIDVADLFR
jgi:hypothetical protein